MPSQHTTRRSIAALLIGVVSSAIFAADPDVQILASGGQTVYRVVIAETPSPQVKAVAEDFVQIFAQMTGATIPLVRDSAPMQDREIIIGPSRHLDNLAMYIDWDKLGEEGYVIRTHQPGGHLALFGGPKGGTRNAVYTFLDEHLGCRFYSPALNVIPKIPNLTLGVMHVEEIPVFEARMMNGCQQLDAYWASRNRMNYFTRSGRHGLPGRGPWEFDWKTLQTHPMVADSWFFAGCPEQKYPAHRGVDDIHGNEEIHSLHKDMLLPSALFETHPEYFAFRHKDASLGDDRRNVRHGNCPTGEGAFEIIVENAKAWLRSNPEARMVSVSQVDRYYACACLRCQAAYQQRDGRWTQPTAPDGRPVRPSAERNRWTEGNVREAAVWFDFINRAAGEIYEEFPDVYVHTLAYYWTRYPVENWKPAPNLIVDYEFLWDCRYHSIAQCPHNEELNGFWTTLRQWLKKGVKVHVWDGVYYHSVIPWPFFTEHRNLRYKEFAMAGVHGVRVHMGFGAQQWLGDLRAYLHVKLLWNPDFNFNAGIAEYCRHAYGPAAEPMLRYVFETQDPANYVWLDWHLGYKGKRPPGFHRIPSDLVKPEVVAHWDTLFQQAQDAAADNADCLTRVERQLKYHNMYKDYIKRGIVKVTEEERR